MTVTIFQTARAGNFRDRPMEEDLQKKQAEERQEYLKSFAVSPNMFIDIPARGTGHFDITFQPSKKMEFEEKAILTSLPKKCNSYRLIFCRFTLRSRIT